MLPQLIGLWLLSDRTQILRINKSAINLRSHSWLVSALRRRRKSRLDIAACSRRVRTAKQTDMLRLCVIMV